MPFGTKSCSTMETLSSIALRTMGITRGYLLWSKKICSSMKPQKAASLIEELDMRFAVELLVTMKVKPASIINPVLKGKVAGQTSGEVEA